MSKSKYLQPKDVVLQRSKFGSKETGGKERTASDPGGASGSTSTASASTASRGIPVVTAKKTASKLLRRNTIHISPLTSNPHKRLREHESMMNEHAQNIEGDVFTTPDTTLDQSKMDISYGKGLKRIPNNNYIVLPDNNKFLIDRYKTYLSNLFLGHKLDYNEANFVAERLLKKKLLNKKQYTYFLNILNKN